MERYTYFDGGKWRLKIGDTEYSGDWVDRLAAYEETGLEPEELAQAEKKGRLVVLPRLHGKKLLRDGLEFEPNHWNITLTAFAHNQPTKSGTARTHRAGQRRPPWRSRVYRPLR